MNRNANQPAGPGTPKREERDAATQQEQIDDVLPPVDGGDDAGNTGGADPGVAARHAERNARTAPDTGRGRS